MTKNDLISYLRSYSQAYDEYVDCAQESKKLLDRIKYLKEMPPRPTVDNIQHKRLIEFVALGIYIVAVVILAALSYVIINPIEIPDGMKIIITLLVSLGIPGILVLMAYYKYINSLLDQKYKLILKQHTDARFALPELEKQLQQKRQLLNGKGEKLNRIVNQNIIPWHYRTGGYARIFLDYLEKGRADTLKEAINLWNLEEHQFAMREEQRRHNEEMERQQKRYADLATSALEEAERAVESQEATRKDVNFWGLMNFLKDDK